MFTFLTSLLVVSFICLCFFKKKFWENRYLVLFISGCVAIVATLTVNFATRNGLDTRVETITKYSIQVMNLNDSLIDSTFFTVDSERGFADHLHEGDTAVVPKYSRHLFFYNADGNFKVGFAVDDDLKSRQWDNLYILPSENDSIGYFAKERKYYAPEKNNWIAEFSLPHIQTVRCLYLPPSEYAAVPDSLIREYPFN